MKRSFPYQNATISYRIEGKGKPVVLLHGFGEDNHIWDAQVSFLKAHCLLIIPDLPGTGESSLLSLGFGFGVWGLFLPKPQTPNPKLQTTHLYRITQIVYMHYLNMRILKPVSCLATAWADISHLLLLKNILNN